MFDWITSVMEQTGYLGVALLMFLENVFPPIPSELIMPLAGFTAARGELSLVMVIVAGSVGSVAGALFWYYIGRWFGCDRIKRLAARYGRWLTVAPSDVDSATSWFRRHGGLSVFLGRLIPAVRTLISVPAGVAGMGLGRFLVYSTAGTVIWTGALATLGYVLEDQYSAVADWVDPVSTVVVVGVVAAYLYRVVTFPSADAT